MARTAIQTVQQIPLAQLRPHPRNYQAHPASQIAKLAASLKRFGQRKNIVAWQQDGFCYVVAGHGLVEAAQQVKLPALLANVFPAETPEDEVLGYMVADNETARWAEPDLAQLEALLQAQLDAGYSLESVGYTLDELEALTQQLEQEAAQGQRRAIDDPGGGGDDFEAEPEAEPICKLGDVWQLGRHRIACINALEREAVQALMGDDVPSIIWSDPPYGISIVAANGYVGGGEAYDIPFGGVKNRGDVGGGAAHIRKTGKPYIAQERGTDGAPKPFGSKASRGSDGAANMIDVGKYYPVIGDDSPATAIAGYKLCAELFPKALSIWWGANYYANALPPSSCWLVWDKENTGNFADCELAWCNHKGAARLFRHMWNGLMKDSERGQRRVHPTQKPIALAAWAFEKYGEAGHLVYDPFLGSGISIIAAERLGEDWCVIGCELSPEYIDVICKRWEAETGEKAVRL